MLEKLYALFDMYEGGVICENDGEILYTNSAAKLMLGEEKGAKKISDVFPKHILMNDKERYVFSAELDGVVSVSVCKMEGFRVFLISRPADDEERIDALCASIGETLKSSVSVLQMSASLVRPHIENLRNPQLTTYASMMTHSGFAILRTASNLTRAKELKKKPDVVRMRPYELVDIVELCENIFGTVSHFTRKNRAALEFKSNVAEAFVSGNKTQLETAILNLLSNSFKYTPETGRITLSVSNTGDHAVITVSDTGCGIPDNVMKNVFARYREPRNTVDARSGLGIGLAVTSHIARRHNGNILLKSKEGKGTQVSLVLPIEKKPEMLKSRIEPYEVSSPFTVLETMADVLAPECYGPEYLD